MNQAWKLTAITLSRVQYQQSKVISLGLGRTIEDVDENITDPETRNALSNAIRGGAAPRHENDSPSDLDTFPVEAKGQESEEATPQD